MTSRTRSSEVRSNCPVSRGTLTVRATLPDAVAYALALGCEISSARLDGSCTVLDVSASQRALDRVACAQVERIVVYVPDSGGADPGWNPARLRRVSGWSARASWSAA